MKSLVLHDCGACAGLRGRVADLERRVAGLEQARPHLRLLNGQAPPSAELAPVWPPLPRARRLRADAAHAAPGPHPLLIAVFVPARDGAAYHRDGDDGAARPRLLDRVA